MRRDRLVAGLTLAGLLLVVLAAMRYGDRIEHWLLKLHGR